MKRKFFSGNSIEQALMQAARHFDLQPEEVAYRRLEKKHGFLRVRRRVVIEVDEESPRREPGAAKERPPRAERPSGTERRVREGATAERRGRPQRPEGDGGREAAGEGERRPRPGREGRGEGERRPRSGGEGRDEERRRPRREDGGRPAAEDEAPPTREVRSRRPRGRRDEDGGGRRRAGGRPESRRSPQRGAADDDGPWWQLASPPEEDELEESGSFEVEEEDFEDDEEELDRREAEADQEVGEAELEEEVQPARERRRPRPQPRRREESRSEGEMSPRVLDAAAEAAERIAELAGLEVSAAASAGDDRVEVDLDGPDRDALLDEDAELLQAVEYLVPRVMRGLVGESFAVRVDSGGYRAEREESLKRMARETAELVARTGRPVSLEPMSPAERRIVHVALRDEPDVRTESQGDGYYKQVTVEPL